MKKPFITLVLSALALPVLLADPQNLDSSHVALSGYDAVGYFVDHQAEKGQAIYHVDYNGGTYLFASKEHADLFAKDPAKYAPQFGGYCAYGVSRGKKAPISPDAYQIIDGKLYLQYDTDIRDDFNKDQAGNLAKALANWPKIVADSK